MTQKATRCIFLEFIPCAVNVGGSFGTINKACIWAIIITIGARTLSFVLDKKCEYLNFKKEIKERVNNSLLCSILCIIFLSYCNCVHK